jgi:hypothetical protein
VPLKSAFLLLLKGLPFSCHRQANKLPGPILAANSFLTERINETLSGYRTPVVVNVIGNNRDHLDQEAGEVVRVLGSMRGAAQVQIQSPLGMPQIVVRLRKDDLVRWGFDPLQVLDAVRTAYGGDIVGNRGKVHGGDGFAMIAQKRQPLPSGFRISGRSFHPTGDAALRYVEAQHQKFTMNAGSAPGGVLSYHAEDQLPGFFRDSFSAYLLPHLGDEVPVQTEAGSMPTHHGLRSHHDERLFPLRPESAGDHPEEFVEHAEFGFRMLALQHGDLLPEREILQ